MTRVVTILMLINVMVSCFIELYKLNVWFLEFSDIKTSTKQADGNYLFLWHRHADF